MTIDHPFDTLRTTVAVVVLCCATLLTTAGVHAQASTTARRDADRVRIQRHLSAVEQRLRGATTDHLDAAQRRARAGALDRLHEYWTVGVFPENDYTQGYTPVFIDHDGRACAVGDLLLHTGYEQEARTIAQRQNLAAVYDIDAVDLTPWLELHGFSIEEAQQIQPSYAPPCCVDVPERPVCGNDGNVYASACVAMECFGVGVQRVCTETPCPCRTREPGTSDAGPDASTDAGVDSGAADTGPETNPGGNGCRVAAGGSGSPALGALLLGAAMLWRRRRRR